MKLLPATSNYQQKQNFGMLKITGAATPEELEEGVSIVRELTQDIYKPFKVSDALNPEYKRTGTLGGWSLRKYLDPSKLPEYEANGDVLIFDRELSEKIWTDGNIAENFDERFRHPTEIAIETLRQHHSDFEKSREIVELFDEALRAAKDTVKKVLQEATKAFGEKS